jgi:hypothetical protein
MQHEQKQRTTPHDVMQKLRCITGIFARRNTISHFLTKKRERLTNTVPVPSLR